MPLPAGANEGGWMTTPDLPRTMTMRFLNPRKLGAEWLSWLKVDGLETEWTAAVCRYFRSSDLRRAAVAASRSFLDGGVAVDVVVVDVSDALGERTGRRLSGMDAASMLVAVDVAEFMADQNKTRISQSSGGVIEHRIHGTSEMGRRETKR